MASIRVPFHWIFGSEVTRAGCLTGPSEQEIDDLFKHNIELIDRLHVPAGSLVKGLIMELERRDTYIRLDNPVPGGHMVEYECVQGVKSLVERVGRALGFKTITDTLLQVPNGY